VTAALEADGGNETLNLGTRAIVREIAQENIINSRLGVGFSIGLLLALDLTPDNELPDIVLLGQVEELADLGGTLGAETLGEDDIGQSGDILLALLDDDEGKNGDIGADDAATDGLAPALTSTANSVARVAVGEEEADTVRNEDTLLHGEALLVVSTSDTENVALPLVTKRVPRNLLRHLLVEEDTAERKNRH